MRKLICILASAALLGACEQKTDVVAPAAPVQEKKPEEAGTSDQHRAVDPNTFSRAQKKAAQTETQTKTDFPVLSTSSSSPTP